MCMVEKQPLTPSDRRTIVLHKKHMRLMAALTIGILAFSYVASNGLPDLQDWYYYLGGVLVGYGLLVMLFQRTAKKDLKVGVKYVYTGEIQDKIQRVLQKKSGGSVEKMHTMIIDTDRVRVPFAVFQTYAVGDHIVLHQAPETHVVLLHNKKM